jgi:hypothetical protein
MTDKAKNAGPMLLELDGRTWEQMIDRAERWFGNVLATQGAFRRHVESTLAKIQELDARDLLGDILEKANQHERQAEELFALIGRKPPTSRKAAGALISGAQKALGKVEGVAGGATAGGWSDLRQCLLLNVDSLGAFAVAEQLGFALAMPDISKVTFEVENDKAKHQLVMQELILETAAINILYEEPA